MRPAGSSGRPQRLCGVAPHVGIIQSLLTTCRLQGVDPNAYLVDILQRVSLHPARQVEGITPATAWLLSQALDTTPGFWSNVQATYDLSRSRPARPVDRLAAVG